MTSSRFTDFRVCISLELTTFYDERFGMTAEEAVAIMGAHTLGSASTDNSGFKVSFSQWNKIILN